MERDSRMENKTTVESHGRASMPNLTTKGDESCRKDTEMFTNLSIPEINTGAETVAVERNPETIISGGEVLIKELLNVINDDEVVINEDETKGKIE